MVFIGRTRMRTLDEMMTMIKNDPSIQRYKELESIILKDKRLKSEIQQLKVIQKQMVNAEHIGKMQAHQQYKSTYETRLDALYEHPLLSEYLALQSDINHLLQEIVGILEDGINKDIET
jgi:cell fate (sporulation/competence/biofilm development) regulator YmcA (YheA/YmcA/DUF963 family)